MGAVTIDLARSCSRAVKARKDGILTSAIAANSDAHEDSPVMLWILLIGFVGGLLALLPWLARARRASDRAIEESQRCGEDRERLLEFMHMMTEALGEGLSRAELQQRIVHAAIVCTDALSACIFERTDRGTMRAAAVEGLFPPHRPLSEIAGGKLITRVKFIEQVLM